MSPGAYLFVPHRGGEPLLAIVRQQYRALFFTPDGNYPLRNGGKPIWIPVMVARDFGVFVPLVAQVAPETFAAPLRRAGDHRVQIHRLQPALNGHFQPHPTASASVSRVEGKNGPDRIDRERNAGGLR